MIKYPIFFLTGQWWHIWNGSVPIEFLHYIPWSQAVAFWMADLRLRSEDTTRKISQNKHSQAAAAHSSHRRRWRWINQTLLSELCGLEPREITLSSSAWLQDSGTRNGWWGISSVPAWRNVSSVCGCGGVCRPLENTFCCNGYWHVSSEEPGHQLTAAKLARTHSPPPAGAGCVMSNRDPDTEDTWLVETGGNM